MNVPVFTRYCLSVLIREIRGSNSVFRLKDPIGGGWEQTALLYVSLMRFYYP